MEGIDDLEHRQDGMGSRLPPRIVGTAFVIAIGMSILRVSMDRPEWVASWLITATFLLFACLLILATYRYGPPLERPTDRVLAGLRIGLPLILLLVVFQSGTPGIGLGIHRSAELLVIYLVLVSFCVLTVNPRQYSPGQWLFIGCFAIVSGIFFYHSVGVGEVSPRARHPLWWGTLVGVNLLVLPRFLTTDQLVWALNRLAAVLVVLALPIYVVGEYSLLGLPFTFHSSFEIPLLGNEVRATRSLFVNRNTFAEVAFVGVVGGVAEVHRSIRRGGVGEMLGLPSQLLAVNVLGLALSYDRAMWVITPMALAIYGAYVAWGRRSIPLAVTAAFTYVIVGLLAVYLGVLDTHTSNRFALWAGGVASIVDQPSLLGAGLIPPGRFMADYHDLWTQSPHNSYISIWIRTGIIGGVAYAILVVGSTIWGAISYRDVDVTALALAAGFGAHQLFEAYTLFQSGMGSVLATIAIGFLLFGGPQDDGSGEATGGGSDRSSPGAPDNESGDEEIDGPTDRPSGADDSIPDYVGEESDAPTKL